MDREKLEEKMEKLFEELVEIMRRKVDHFLKSGALDLNKNEKESDRKETNNFLRYFFDILTDTLLKTKRRLEK